MDRIFQPSGDSACLFSCYGCHGLLRLGAGLGLDYSRGAQEDVIAGFEAADYLDEGVVTGL